jgi:FtsZ-binding cell division protein ZapB
MNDLYEKIKLLKIEIEEVKEYVNTDMCKKCDEFNQQLKELQQMLDEYSRTNMDNQE